jgi:hypothetical protein
MFSLHCVFFAFRLIHLPSRYFPWHICDSDISAILCRGVKLDTMVDTRKVMRLWSDDFFTIESRNMNTTWKKCSEESNFRRVICEGKKVKLSLCLISISPWRIIGEWRYSSTIVDHSTGRSWVVSFRPQPLQTRERVPCTYCIGGWVGPRAGMDTWSKELLPLPAIEPRSSSLFMI